ncbi:unnamed protein product [Moneuplotes crassus]|uniref:Uncharacterized protein n=1 Tax=Euplotes crassus TaxID=5936 RepID=A0AAD1UAF8_EUPCR|nr:unnamed protein product [Moneuplotes crassus]
MQFTNLIEDYEDDRYPGLPSFGKYKSVSMNKQNSLVDNSRSRVKNVQTPSDVVQNGRYRDYSPGDIVINTPVMSNHIQINQAYKKYKNDKISQKYRQKPIKSSLGQSYQIMPQDLTYHQKVLKAKQKRRKFNTSNYSVKSLNKSTFAAAKNLPRKRMNRNQSRVHATQTYSTSGFTTALEEAPNAERFPQEPLLHKKFTHQASDTDMEVRSNLTVGGSHYGEQKAILRRQISAFVDNSKIKTLEELPKNDELTRKLKKENKLLKKEVQRLNFELTGLKVILQRITQKYKINQQMLPIKGMINKAKDVSEECQNSMNLLSNSLENIYLKANQPSNLQQKCSDYIQHVLLENQQLREMLEIKTENTLTVDHLTKLEQEVQEILLSEESVDNDTIELTKMVKKAITETSKRKSKKAKKEIEQQTITNNSAAKEPDHKNMKPKSKFLFDSPENSDEEESSQTNEPSSITQPQGISPLKEPEDDKLATKPPQQDASSLGIKSVKSKFLFD